MRQGLENDVLLGCGSGLRVSAAVDGETANFRVCVRRSVRRDVDTSRAALRFLDLLAAMCEAEYSLLRASTTRFVLSLGVAARPVSAQQALCASLAWSGDIGELAVFRVKIQIACHRRVAFNRTKWRVRFHLHTCLVPQHVAIAFAFREV